MKRSRILFFFVYKLNNEGENMYYMIDGSLY